MPIRPRILIENACYHIITRGNARQEIFLNDMDRLRYLALVKRVKTKFGFKLYGYCLMPNHVHLLIEPKRPKDTAGIMRSLNLAYTRRFNYKYKRVGHLWQGRFKSKVILKDNYLFDCLRYIEFNPVRANITDTPEGYMWSSYRYNMDADKNGLLDEIEI